MGARYHEHSRVMNLWLYGALTQTLVVVNFYGDSSVIDIEHVLVHLG
jgi:hypothetical protein